jgi:glyoxylase-like metal-dependent hydrolase (beta-lactamase superfamily II)
VVAAWDKHAVVFNERLMSFLYQAGVPCERHSSLVETFGFTRGRMRTVSVTLTLDEEQPPEGVRVIHTSGHSPGHVCLLVGDVLLCGDHILARTIPQQWPESLAAYTGLGHYLESLGKTLRLDGVSVALGGHEPPIRNLRHRIEEILAAQRRRLQRVVDIATGASQPVSVAEIAQRIYSRQQGFYELLALIDVGSRVEYLERHGCLEIVDFDNARRNSSFAYRYRATRLPVDLCTEMIAPQGTIA